MIYDTKINSSELQNKGWVKIENAVSKTAVEEMKDWIFTAIERASTELTFQAEYEPENKFIVRKIRRLFWSDPGFWKVALKKAGVFDLARSIVGENAGLIYHAAFNKVSKIGS